MTGPLSRMVGERVPVGEDHWGNTVYGMIIHIFTARETLRLMVQVSAADAERLRRGRMTEAELEAEDKAHRQPYEPPVLRHLEGEEAERARELLERPAPAAEEE